MLAVEGGHANIVKILLDKGADVSIVTDDERFTALHFCAKSGNAAIAKMLVSAGANLVAVSSTTGSTPLHIASEEGHVETMTVLIEAGASLNYRTPEGETPLYTSCGNDQVAAVRVLLRAKADPLLASTDPLGQTFLPLDIAVFRGHSGVVRELLQQLGAEGCGGASGGVHALQIAAQGGELGMMAALTGAGVVDTGEALVDAAGYGGEASVKFLLQRWWQRRQLSADSSRGDAYVNARDNTGRTPLISGILLCRPCSPRIVRMLVDAGADAVSAVRLATPEEVPFFHGTPLNFVKLYADQKREDDASEETLNIVEGVRRLLLRVVAVHAVSWLWHSSSDTPAASRAAADIARTRTASAMISTPLTRMLPILRRRANRRGVVLASLFR